MQAEQILQVADCSKISDVYKVMGFEMKDKEERKTFKTYFDVNSSEIQVFMNSYASLEVRD